ncbi:FMN-binding protein [Actinoplanes sp. KI2]|uniref:FMN-binding protein n=1 Tax=Actinoplanes sp. KI2 TaxID=2983315 RepID=UPI0021D5F669|nr:FMN-binding protein [Actinoplanes sp. KI2]MCU7729394.1 FMN-binding protein [Actinoplanes sp. KI2]
MRRVTLWIVSTISAVVMLFSYRTSLGNVATADATTQVDAAGAHIVPVPGGVAANSAAPTHGTHRRSASPAAKAPATRTLTVDGAVAQTQRGPVQVRVTITGNTIVNVRALQHPTGNSTDDQINAYALPKLRAEVLAAQSARVDAVSGATVTSGGYLRSLQSALDAAHLG